MEQAATPCIVQLCLLNKMVETPQLSIEIILYTTWIQMERVS